MDIQSKEIELVSISSVKANPKNNNKHSPEQIERLVKLMKFQGFRNPIVISRRSGFIVAGHGRVEAAKQLGMTKVPAMFQDFEDEAQEYAYLTSDNSIASWAELDLSAVTDELLSLGSDFDTDLLGIKDFGSFLEDDENKDTDAYTKKIEAPIYEPKGEKPKVSELYDLNKTNKLLDRIRKSDIDKGIKVFLEQAARRHTVFDYEKVAEYYAHSPKEVQELMEDSALVIIDFKKAIENGFVVLSDKIAEAFKNEG